MTESEEAFRVQRMTESWQIRYVRQVLQKTALTASALARRSGFSSTTLTRALNSDDHKFTLSLATLDKIAAATGISYAGFADDPHGDAPDPVLAEIVKRLAELDQAERDALLAVAEVMIARRHAAGPQKP